MPSAPAADVIMTGQPAGGSAPEANASLPGSGAAGTGSGSGGGAGSGAVHGTEVSPGCYLVTELEDIDWQHLNHQAGNITGTDEFGNLMPRGTTLFL